MMMSPKRSILKPRPMITYRVSMPVSIDSRHYFQSSRILSNTTKRCPSFRPMTTT